MASTEPVRVFTGMVVNGLGTSNAQIALNASTATKVFARDVTFASLAIAGNGDAFRELTNEDAAITIYIGPTSAVTAANGYPVKPGQPFGVAGGAGKLWLGDVWAIAASGTPLVATIQW